MKNHFGKCALCGKECELTFEHVPPRAAFNSTPARPVSGNEIFKEEVINDKERMPWDTEGLKYQNQQQGMGRYSLCQECNNNTGSWYGDAYITFARTAHTAIKNRTPEDPDGIGFKDMYPARIIKQVLSMLCSINSPEKPQFEELREFVLDKDAVGIDKSKYKLCMYFTETTLYKYAGFSVLLRESASGFESMAMTELTAYPFGFILYFNSTETWPYHGTDITGFADWHYDDKAIIEMPWKIEEMNDIFPEHFRSREEIEKCVEYNIKWAEEHT